MKNFYTDNDSISILKKWNSEFSKEIIKKWNEEVPTHIQRFNNYKEDRNAVLYLTLFVEYHLNQCLSILFPDFDSLLGLSKTATSSKINFLASFRILPVQIFDAMRCLNNIRNEFAHDIDVINLSDLSSLTGSRLNRTVTKLTELTDNFEGDYMYGNEIRDRFKSLCLNTITALRIYEPMIKDLRKQLDQRI